ncbi:hypothetical protein I4U23_019674 [Adineta vaga]|nr:hypothetical protein I4U23_019674 [Adineta vaga]
MARSILVMCIVLSAFVHMNLANTSNTVGTHIQNGVSQMLETTGNQIDGLKGALNTKISGIADEVKLTQVTALVGNLKSALGTLLSNLQGVATEAISAAVETIQNALDGLKGVVSNIVTTLGTLISALTAVVQSLLTAVGAILNLLGNILGGLVDALTRTLGGLSNTLEQLTTALVRWTRNSSSHCINNHRWRSWNNHRFS